MLGLSISRIFWILVYILVAAFFLHLEAASKKFVKKEEDELIMTTKCVHSRAYKAARKAAIDRGETDVDLLCHV